MKNASKKKMLKVALISFIASNFFLSYFGISSILLTISFYLFLLILLKYCIREIYGASQKAKNIGLLITTLIISLFLGEVILKYVFKSHLNYGERNGKFFYQSEYKQDKLYNLSLKLGQNYKKEGLINKPNSKSNIRKPDFNYTHYYNKYGLRNAASGPDSSKFTILCMGDSFTEGVGAPDDSTWVRLLNDRLNESNSSAAKIKCINGGVNGSDPFFEYITLKKLLKAFNPKVVIIAINRSDLYEVIVRGGIERFKQNGTVQYNNAPWWEFIYQFSYITRNIVQAMGNYKWTLLSERQNKVAEFEAIEKIKEVIFNQYVKLSEEHNFELMILLLPSQYELEMNKFAMETLYVKLIKNNKVKTYNLFPKFKQYAEINKIPYSSIYWANDLHNNSSGYKVLADMIYDELIELPILDIP